jgi:hypothetical protein
VIDTADTKVHPASGLQNIDQTIDCIVAALGPTNRAPYPLSFSLSEGKWWVWVECQRPREPYFDLETSHDLLHVALQAMLTQIKRASP